MGGYHSPCCAYCYTAVDYVKEKFIKMLFQRYMELNDGINVTEGVDIFEFSIDELICIYLPSIFQYISHIKLLQKYQVRIDGQFTELEQKDFLSNVQVKMMNNIRNDTETQAKIACCVYKRIRGVSATEEQMECVANLYRYVKQA